MGAGNKDDKIELMKKYKEEYNSRFGPFGEERLSKKSHDINIISNNEDGIDPINGDTKL